LGVFKGFVFEPEIFFLGFGGKVLSFFGGRAYSKYEDGDCRGLELGFFGRKDDDMLWRLRSSSSMLSLCWLMILGGGLDKTLPQPKPRRSRMVNITLSEPPLTFLSRVCL
jgi:hypothetical protein